MPNQLKKIIGFAMGLVVFLLVIISYLPSDPNVALFFIFFGGLIGAYIASD